LSCDFTLFLVGPFSGKQIPAPATIQYTLLYARSKISHFFNSFSFFHPLFLQLSRCSLVMLPPCCCYLILYVFKLFKLSHWCCTRRLRKGFLSANYSKPWAGCCCHTLVSSFCTTRSLGGHTRGFRYHNCWLESQFPLVLFLRAAASHSIYHCRPFLLSREAINCLQLRVPGNCAIGHNICLDKVVLWRLP